MELLMALAVLAIVLGLAAPSMQTLLQEARQRSEVSRLRDAIQLARGEAAARHRPVSVCPAAYSAGGELRCGGNYSAGWLVLEGEPDASAVDSARLLRVFPAVAGGLRIADRAGVEATTAVTYYPDGATRKNLTLTVCSIAHPAQTGWSLVINLVGRARLARDWGRCDAV